MVELKEMLQSIWDSLPQEPIQGSHKPGKPGIIREFCKPTKVREKSEDLR